MISDSLCLTKLPFALYFKPQDFGDKITLSGRLRDAAGGLLDGEPLILPSQRGAPPQVPQIQLASRDKSYVFQLSSVRLSLEWTQRTREPKTWSGSIGPYMKTLGGILRIFVGEYASPQRFAFNPQFVFPMKQSANEYLAKHLFQRERIGQAPFACKVGLMDQVTIQQRRVNLWINVATARQRQKIEEDKALVVQFDVLSADKNGPPLGSEEILAIFSEIEVFMERRLNDILGELLEPES